MTNQARNPHTDKHATTLHAATLSDNVLAKSRCHNFGIIPTLLALLFYFALLWRHLSIPLFTFVLLIQPGILLIQIQSIMLNGWIIFGL